MTKTMVCAVFVSITADADCSFAPEFELAAPDSHVKILIAPIEPGSLRLAAQDLINNTETSTSRNARQ